MQTSVLVIAGTHSGVGKTTVSIALMAAFNRRGLCVQPFKIGPDFIDPSLHTRAAERVSRNLDGWMLKPETNVAILNHTAHDADIAIIEGVMGLFDGREATTEVGSTAEMAKLLGVPVLLIVDGAAMARSVAAVVHGFETFDDSLQMAGVIFNRVANEGHFAYLRNAIEAHCRTRVLGWLRVDEGIALPERHLGLVMGEEVLDKVRLNLLADWVERSLDLESLLTIARQPTACDAKTVIESEGLPSQVQMLRRHPRIGIARDQAFCFYYQDNLDLLSECGAELVEFSPVNDACLPDNLDGLYFGGGYPELHAAALEANGSMRSAVSHFALSGRPVYAECGGFMYLTEMVIDADGREHSMVGLFPTKARVQKKLAALGYAEVTGTHETGWLRAGESARGHEFRYSMIDDLPASIMRLYSINSRGRERCEGFAIRATLASYIHLHFKSCPQMAARFLSACANYS